ncbi:hypothetical protein AC579_2587 [Pseudocercospora musae]|uniref:Uncharacterized protein n=1 Tax=Pseudocercospora musae TaxID=113226 RepID=A0A139IEV1_9PEZI|nr:hypothetical protein AC579_2587 [Pseudocercospora musae]
MVKINNSARELRRRVDALVDRYGRLETQYAAMPLRNRRYLCVGSSYESFCAAMIFEAGLSRYCREEDESLDILGALPTHSEHFQHELLPVALTWFADLAAFYKRAHDEERSLTTYILGQEQIVLAGLEWKCEQASKLLTHLTEQSSPVSGATVPSRSMETFATACAAIAQGMSVDTAMAAGEFDTDRYKYDNDEFMATEGVRQWFPIDVNMPAWPSADQKPDFAVWRQGNAATAQQQFPPGSSFSSPRVFDFSNASQSSGTKASGIWSERTSGLSDSQQGVKNSGGWWNKNPNKDAAVNSMPPPPPPALKVDSKARLTEYDARWKSLAPHDREFPYPNSTLSMSGFQNRQALPYHQQKIALWSLPTIIGVMTKRFFTNAFDIRTTLVTFPNDLGKVDYALQKSNTTSTVAALRKTLKMESVKWHPDRLNRRSGNPGVLDQSIGDAPSNVAIRSAVQELIEECDKFVNGGNEWRPDEKKKDDRA